MHDRIACVRYRKTGGRQWSRKILRFLPKIINFFFFLHDNGENTVTRNGRRTARGAGGKRTYFSTAVVQRRTRAHGGEVNDRLGLRMAGAGGVLRLRRRSRRTRSVTPTLVTEPVAVHPTAGRVSWRRRTGRPVGRRGGTQPVSPYGYGRA